MPTHLQQQIIYKVGGLLSCIGSGYIIQDVLRHPDKRSKIYPRIMVGLSAMDILLSFFAFVLGSWSMPKGSYLWAAGNMTSCDAVAFIAIFGAIGSPLYNCSLATYFSLKLKYNWQDHRIKRIQKWFHIVPCLIALLYSITTLCTKTIGPSHGYCGITFTDYPWGCSNEPDSELKCIRSVGMMDTIFILTLYFFPFICLLYVSITMFRVYKTVRDIEANVIKYSFIARHREQEKKKTMKRSRRIMIQGVLYSVAMILTWTFAFIIVVIVLISKQGNEVLQWITNVLNPLQGAFNFLIYLIPVFRKMIKTHRLQKKELENKALINKNGNKEKNGMVSYISSSSGNTISSSRGNKMSVRFQEEKEEEKHEIAPLPAVFSLAVVSENGQDEESCIYETRNNKKNNDDDGNDYY